MEFTELKWIEFLKKTIKRAQGVYAGIGDDCAVIQDSKTFYLVTSDLFIEGVHFKRGSMSFFNIGRRAAARAVSDIAACCGVPRFIMVSLGLPSGFRFVNAKKMLKGIEEVASVCGASIIGGDTSFSPKLFLDICVMGKARKPVLRNTARNGDYIFVTGRLGRLAFNRPFVPRLKEAMYIAGNFKVNAMIDISDGFIVDLYRIIEASNKGAVLYKDKIPLTHGYRDMYRGEDYELIFTVDKSEPRIGLLKKRFYWVGYIQDKRLGYYFDIRGRKEKVKIKGYLHF